MAEDSGNHPSAIVTSSDDELHGKTDTSRQFPYPTAYLACHHSDDIHDSRHQSNWRLLLQVHYLSP
ncbi:hypothetical protein M404DRAFT_652133 [Pisolithus tinctorius Marx 270]|uniref:Uncharacterized protein n=1 Tax=Pisolithus tinctorius Marx 270 TaxID=870435 RepID=A0A0C3P503_PISTI|nr:hypothetical protein M404DRAFT_652133 [Pisolithus tinctorius Marx 270]